MTSMIRILLLPLFMVSFIIPAPAFTLTNGAYHVSPGEEIQGALDSAATNAVKLVKVHAGVYRPNNARQALIWLNRKHDGIHLEAEGEVVLTAANGAISDVRSASHPAIVNHIVYFGNGISSNTVMKGFHLTGANNFILKARNRQMEPSNEYEMGVFFYTDGGAVKVFGRSYPVLDSLVLSNNYSSPCAGGISIQHPEGQTSTNQFVTIRNCQFFDNRAQVTGAALDLLEGSSAVVDNCLFVKNRSNLGPDFISVNASEQQFTNNAALTVFRTSWIVVKNSTFSGNRNGADDLGNRSRFEKCIFWNNDLEAGLPAPRYDLVFNEGTVVSGCYFSKKLDPDSKQTNNTFFASAPDFDAQFNPLSLVYTGVGYRSSRR